MIHRHIFAALCFTLLTGMSLPSAFAQDNVTSKMDEAAVEKRANAINKTLRCVICQNQSIADSHSPLAEDMRHLVERRVRLGDSDDEVRAYMQQRYGDFVLMKPPVQANTWFLWFGPFALLIIGGGWYLWRIRQKQAVTDDADTALSDEELARLNDILSETQDKS